MYCYICSKLRSTRSKYCFGFDTVYYKSTGHPASLLFSAQTFDLGETFPKLRVCIAYIPSSLCARLWLDITEYECFGCLQLIKWLYLSNPISGCDTSTYLSHFLQTAEEYVFMIFVLNLISHICNKNINPINVYLIPEW